MKPLADCILYTFVDAAFLRGRAPVDVARQLCEGGSDLIQLRAKDVSIDGIRRMAEAILPVTTAAGVGLVINDHWELASEIGAPLCHLGQEDFFDAGHTHVSSLTLADFPLTPHSRLRAGLSTHSPDQARRAVAAGADYIAIGPVYPTGTKPSARPVTLDYVRWAAANVGIPWFAIGGITLENLDDVLGAGARRICVVSAILKPENIAAACRQFKSRMESAQ
jgi:thiamine-phosphate pyrophosphorylase